MMLITTLFTASLAMFALGDPNIRLPCSTISGTPCNCPVGTEYSESSTFAVLGATASDVGLLLNDFSNPAWTGNDPLTLQGPNNVPILSYRERNLSTSVGSYVFRERLMFRYESLIDGSFEQRFEQRGAIPYASGNGSFQGLWTTLKGDRVFQNQTLVEANIYACQTGYPINFAEYYQTGLANATNILTAVGLIRGVNVSPASVQLF
ncbi:hypothetical protein GQX73_g3298 [Xylaria multiplex]|uniref:Uncharacterized protein n=1 Tax=Xylaria multiplex TaxID=323545 RepID=A0A7C8MWN4_9PEZI|nr:hypothetical protein GQX73_g3298 [Xylaria multiplex]